MPAKINEPLNDVLRLEISSSRLPLALETITLRAVGLPMDVSKVDWKLDAAVETFSSACTPTSRTAGNQSVGVDNGIERMELRPDGNGLAC